jgi:uncharacterized protein (TIRG00374 family)
MWGRLFFPIEGTRLYHDRFNFSVNPLFHSESHEGPDEPQQRHRRKIAAVALGLTAVAICAFFLGTRGKAFDWPTFVDIVSGLDWGWLGISLAFSYATYVVRALRWGVLLRPLRPHARFTGLLSATVIGYSSVTALGRPAEMVRPYLIAVRESVPFSSQVAAWVVERLYDVLIALAVFGFALSQVSGSGAYLGVALSWALRAGGFVIGAGASVCLAALIAMKYWSEQIQRWTLRAVDFLSTHHLKRVERLIEGFLDGVRCTKSQSATVQMIGYTLAEWLLVAACYACVLKAFGGALDLAPVDVLVLMGFVSFGSLVQLPAVGGGAQVTAVLVLTEIYGAPIEIATWASLLLWGISFVAIVPIGAALAVHEGLSWARLREARGGTLA